MKYSTNKKTNAVLEAIDASLRELGLDEVKRYVREFPNETDHNIAQYGNLIIYYDDVRKLYTDCGYNVERDSDSKLWETYKRQVGYVANQLIRR